MTILSIIFGVPLFIVLMYLLMNDMLYRPWDSPYRRGHLSSCGDPDHQWQYTDPQTGEQRCTDCDNSL